MEQTAGEKQVSDTFRCDWGGVCFSYIKNQWLSISLKKKLGAFSVVVILVMGLSIAFNMLVMNFSLESFNVILNDNSLCYDVQESMEQEADAFELYVRERSWENAKQYRLACFKTESSLDALPFDYDVIRAGAGMQERGILRMAMKATRHSGTRFSTWTSRMKGLWSSCTGYMECRGICRRMPED